MNIITGKLVSTGTEYKGTKGFPVNVTELSVNDRPVELKATGAMAQRVQALLDEAEPGVIVRAVAVPVFRTYEKDGELRSIYDMEITDIQLLGAIGTQESTFSLQGFIKDIEAKPGKKGNFYIGRVTNIAYDREGNVIENADIEVTINDDLVPLWQAALGKLAIVGGRFSGYKNDKGNIWPRWYADTLSGVMDVPSWLESYAPATAAAPAAPVAAPAVAPATPTF